MMGRKLAPTFGSEADLCAAFIRAVEAHQWNTAILGHWTCYAETEGWDILMVRKEDGCQIGIEAKLALNTVVICQAVEGLNSSYLTTGPDFRAVLVPAERDNSDLRTICHALGITVLSVPYEPERHWRLAAYFPSLGGQSDDFPQDWHPLLPMKRHPLPEYIPDVAAGASAPTQLSRWKIAALKLCVLLEEGPVTRSDFKALGLSPTRWTDRYAGWLVPTPNGYVRGSRLPDFPGQHPTVYAQIKADREKWIFPRKEIGPHHQATLGLENE